MFTITFSKSLPLVYKKPTRVEAGGSNVSPRLGIINKTGELSQCSTGPQNWHCPFTSVCRKISGPLKKNQVFWPDNILLRSRVFRAFQSMFHTPPLFSLRKWIYYLQYFATLFQEFSPMGTNLATFTLTILQWRLPFYFLVKSEEGRKGLSWLNSEPQAAFKVVTLYDSKRNDGSVNELELRGRAL